MKPIAAPLRPILLLRRNLSLCLAAGLCLSMSLPALAHKHKKPATTKADRLSAFTPPVGKKGAPQSTASGATRDRRSCATGDGSLKLALPDSKKVSPTARPQFSLYLPNTAASQVVLALRNPSIGFYERVILPLPPQSGWVNLPWAKPDATIASTAKPIPRAAIVQSPHRQISPLGRTSSQPYEWFVVVVCGSSPEPDDPTFSGNFDPQTGATTSVP